MSDYISITNSRPVRPLITHRWQDFSQTIPPTTGHEIGATYHCTYWDEVYTVLGSAAYDVPGTKLRNVVVLWQSDERQQPDGEIGVHHTQVDGDTRLDPRPQLEAGDRIAWDTMFGETLAGTYTAQHGGTVLATRDDGTPVLLDAIRVRREPDPDPDPGPQWCRFDASGRLVDCEPPPDA